MRFDLVDHRILQTIVGALGTVPAYRVGKFKQLVVPLLPFHRACELLPKARTINVRGARYGLRGHQFLLQLLDLLPEPGTGQLLEASTLKAAWASAKMVIFWPRGS